MIQKKKKNKHSFSLSNVMFYKKNKYCNLKMNHGYIIFFIFIISKLDIFIFLKKKNRTFYFLKKALFLKNSLKQPKIIEILFFINNQYFLNTLFLSFKFSKYRFFFLSNNFKKTKSILSYRKLIFDRFNPFLNKPSEKLFSSFRLLLKKIDKMTLTKKSCKKSYKLLKKIRGKYKIKRKIYKKLDLKKKLVAGLLKNICYHLKQGVPTQKRFLAFNNMYYFSKIKHITKKNNKKLFIKKKKNILILNKKFSLLKKKKKLTKKDIKNYLILQEQQKKLKKKTFKSKVGLIHYAGSRKNLRITITKTNGQVLARYYCGINKIVKKAKRRRNNIKKIILKMAAAKVKQLGLRWLIILYSQNGPSFNASNVFWRMRYKKARIIGFKFISNVPHNGCRKISKKRRKKRTHRRKYTNTRINLI